MPETVKCALLGEQLPAMPMPPLPGELGNRIQAQISHKAWQLWLEHQTMLINEKRLSMGNSDHRQYLKEQMEKFLFGGDFDKPQGYVPPS
ncbi:MAG: oxidative damage protection protein [Acidiferrobacterales bacterium]|nr:oxidative damage protection protein [Acidiferrobacterales bacterium]